MTAGAPEAVWGGHPPLSSCGMWSHYRDPWDHSDAVTASHVQILGVPKPIPRPPGLSSHVRISDQSLRVRNSHFATFTFFSEERWGIKRDNIEKVPDLGLHPTWSLQRLPNPAGTASLKTQEVFLHNSCFVQVATVLSFLCTFSFLIVFILFQEMKYIHALSREPQGI